MKKRIKRKRTVVSKSNGAAQPTQGVLEEIAARLAVISPAQFVNPNFGPDKCFHGVGEATEHGKRLYTLLEHVTDEQRTLMKDAKAKNESLQKKIGDKNSTELMRHLIGGAITCEEVDAVDHVNSLVAEKNYLRQVVYGIFWLEIRRQFPELMGRDTVGIRRHWIVGWSERTASPMHFMGGDMPPHVFMEMPARS